MCAAFEMNDVHLRPGLPAAFWRDMYVSKLVVWAGFAQREKRDWWRRNGGTLVDVPASRFAERSTATGIMRWDDVPAGQVIRGLLIEEETAQPLLKIVTRASTPEELRHFEHPRMPLLEAPLFSAEAIPYPEAVLKAARPVQRELF